MQLNRLYPRVGEIAAEELVAHLDLGSHAPAHRPYVVANMISTVDGKASVDGNTYGLGGAGDRAVFHNLRTQVDAILVGASTATAERYGRPTKTDELRAKREREGLEPDPLTVIVSGRLNLSPQLPLLADPGARVVIATGVEHELEGVAAKVDYVRTGDDLGILLARLRGEYGVRAALCEGGPTLNSFMFAADAIDELWVSTSPLIAGGTTQTIVGGRELAKPSDAQLVWLCEGEGELLARWRLGR